MPIRADERTMRTVRTQLSQGGSRGSPKCVCVTIREERQFERRIGKTNYVFQVLLKYCSAFELVIAERLCVIRRAE